MYIIIHNDYCANRGKRMTVTIVTIIESAYNPYRVVERLKTWDLRKLEKIKKMPKLHGIIA